MPFIAQLEAAEGFLLGGVKVHKSAPFLKRLNAEHWLQQAVNANTKAGNRVGATKITVAMRARRECADREES